MRVRVMRLESGSGCIPILSINTSYHIDDFKWNHALVRKVNKGVCMYK